MVVCINARNALILRFTADCDRRLDRSFISWIYVYVQPSDTHSICKCTFEIKLLYTMIWVWWCWKVLSMSCGSKRRRKAKLDECLDKASTAYRMEISAKKTKLMTDNTSCINNKEIKVNGQKLFVIFSIGIFSDAVKVRSFKLCLINLAWGLHCHCKFDDLDFAARSQVCQKYKLPIACLGFLPCVV